MFAVRKTAAVGIKRLDPKRANAVARLINSRSAFESSSRVRRHGPENEALQRILGTLQQQDNNNNNNESHSGSKKPAELADPFRFKEIEFRNLQTLYPPPPVSFPSGNANPSIDALRDIVRDSSLRALNDASLRILRSALAATIDNSGEIFSQSIRGPMGRPMFIDETKNFQRESRAYYSSGPVNKGGKYSTSVKVPTPKSTSQNSLSPFGSIDPKEVAKKALELSWSLTKTIISFLFRLPGNVFYFATHPKARKDKIAEIKEVARKEFDHYWTGTKLLMADVRTARSLISRTLSGSSLTRRERKQLLRTVSDLFRLVPFSMFLIIPFMEFALPFALRIFPNLLPSTFQDSLKAEESMKRELKSRIAMAQFFQDTLEELAKEQKRIAAKRTSETPDNTIASKQEQSAASMLEFLDRARKGEMIPPDVIVQYANYFQDDLTLDNMPRMQLINMCKYMSIPPYGTDNFLRFQLRHKIRTLKEDDQRILWEGIESLTKMELREACQERGMRSTGLSKEAYKRSLQQWLDLSVHKNVPISLLVMSRIFFLQEEMTTIATGDEDLKSVAGLADAISGLDKEVLNEVILEVATSEEKKSNPDVRKIKLEVLAHQNEKIKEEQEEREAAAKKKESTLAEKSETEAKEEPLLATEVELPRDAHDAKKKVNVKGDEMEDVVVKVSDVTEPVLAESKTEKPESVEEEKIESELSADEMEAISQLLSADPVSKEREELERIKSAIQEKVDSVSNQPEQLEKITSAIRKQAGDEDAIQALGLDIPGKGYTPSQATASPEDYAAARIKAMEESFQEGAEKATTFSTASEIPHTKTQPSAVTAESEKTEEAASTDDAEEEEHEDPVVARLKQRIESMVDKIEVQLSDVQVKIGDKLHFLDKDMDGILSREEMAEVLHQVLKRNISMEEALEIANQIDENKDGVFTVQELIRWIETNKLVKLESEGRDADMDRIMENQSTESSSTDSPAPPEEQNQNSSQKM